MSGTAADTGARIGRGVYLAACVLIFTFLVAPILVIVPLSFNAEPYFTFTDGMLRLDPAAYSLRWYREIIENEAWTRALGNSLLIGVAPRCWRRGWARWPRWGWPAARCRRGAP